MLWHKVWGKAEMKHTKRYARIGDGVELWCGNRLVAKSPHRSANFSMEPCKCGMEVKTIGSSPDTDKVLEDERK